MRAVGRDGKESADSKPVKVRTTAVPKTVRLTDFGAVGNAWIFNNYVRHAHGGVTLGSHTASWIENVLGEDNVFELTEVGFRCKMSDNMGGGGRNSVFRHNVLKDIKNNAFLFTTNYKDENAVGKYAGGKCGRIQGYADRGLQCAEYEKSGL